MKMGMKNALCCLLLLVVLVFGSCFQLPFVAFCSSSLLVLDFEIESVLSQKPKQENAFGCSFWFFVGTKSQNKQQKAKSPNGNQVLRKLRKS